MKRRLQRCAAAGVLAGGFLSGAGLLLAAPSGAGLPPDVRAIDSAAAAAGVGILSRVPAESDGGAVYTSTTISLDKAQAKAAGFTGGDLFEAFLLSSSEHYHNATLINAQHPPTGTVPAESRFDAAAAPKDAPAPAPPKDAPPASDPARLHAVATEAPSATAEAAGAHAVLGDVAVGGATSASASRLAADGTLVTTARSTATDVRIAELLTMASATTVAEATVPRTGPPASTLDVKLAGVALAGVPAEVTPEGLMISDKAAASPVTVAQFNAALAQLQEKGITVTAAPLVQETGAGAARASGGGVRIRYKVADQIGGDEELTLAPASARSAVSRRDADPAGLDGSVPPAVDDAAAGSPLPEAGQPAEPSAVAPPGTFGPVGFGDGSGAGVAPGTAFGGDPDAWSVAGAASFPNVAAGGSRANAAVPNAGTGGSLPAAGPGLSEAALPAAHHGRNPARRLRAGYAVFLVVAAAGVVAVTTQAKARTA